MNVRGRLVARTITHHPPQIKRNINVDVPTYNPQRITAPPRVYQHIHVRSYVRTDEYLTNSSTQALLVPLIHAPARVLLLLNSYQNKREVWVCGPITYWEGMYLL